MEVGGEHFCLFSYLYMVNVQYIYTGTVVQSQ